MSSITIYIPEGDAIEFYFLDIVRYLNNVGSTVSVIKIGVSTIRDVAIASRSEVGLFINGNLPVFATQVDGGRLVKISHGYIPHHPTFLAFVTGLQDYTALNKILLDVVGVSRLFIALQHGLEKLACFKKYNTIEYIPPSLGVPKSQFAQDDRPFDFVYSTYLARFIKTNKQYTEEFSEIAKETIQLVKLNIENNIDIVSLCLDSVSKKLKLDDRTRYSQFVNSLVIQYHRLAIIGALLKRNALIISDISIRGTAKIKANFRQPINYRDLLTSFRLATVSVHHRSAGTEIAISERVTASMGLGTVPAIKMAGIKEPHLIHMRNCLYLSEQMDNELDEIERHIASGALREISLFCTKYAESYFEPNNTYSQIFSKLQ